MQTTIWFLCLTAFLQQISAASVEGCAASLINTNVDGLVGNVYYYPWADNSHDEDDKLVYNEAYQQGGFAANTTIVTANDGHSLTKVATEVKDVISTNLTWVYNSPKGQTEVWGKNENLQTSDGNIPEISITNYALSLNGYVVPKTSGDYTFTLGYSDDLTMFFIGNGNAPIGCCNTAYDSSGVDSSQAQIYRKYTANDPISYTVSLEKGVAYPVGVFYVNINNIGDYSLTYTDPNGVTHEDWTGFAYGIDSESDSETCYVQNTYSTTSLWTGTETTYETFTHNATTVTTIPATNGVPQIVETIITQSIDVNEYDPMPRSTTTMYTPWTGISTLTSTTFTSNFGNTSLEVYVIVETPESTTTTPWTGTDTITVYTSVPTTGPDGETTSTPIVIVKTPESTTTTPWTGTDTVTVYTSVPTTGPDGETTTTPIVIVKTPESTHTTPWTGSTPTTVYTEVPSTLPNGNVTTTPVVIVKTPESTHTTPWTGSTPTTVYTEVPSTLPNGNVTTTPVVIVKTPESTVTTPWTGTDTVTVHTSVPTTGPDGKTTTTPIVIVKTPESTTTTPWTGTDTVTVHTTVPTTGPDGKTTSTPIVIVKTPGTTLRTTVPWTGVSTSSYTTNTVVPGTDGSPSTVPVIVVETPGTTLRTTVPWTGISTSSYTTNTIVPGNGTYVTVPVIVVETPTHRGWNSISLSTSFATDIETVTCTEAKCQQQGSTSLTTHVSTDIETVTCTDYSCQAQSSTSYVPGTIPTTYISSSSSSLVSSVSGAVPSIEVSTVSSSATPSLITTAGENKATSLKVGGLFILILQFI